MPVNIDSICKTSFGAHYCLFYRYREDLVDFLTRYFTQGLDNGEYCMWVTPDAEMERIARMKLSADVPEVDDSKSGKNVRFVNARDWYLRDGGFSSDRVCDSWAEMLDGLNYNQYKGLRVSGDLGWFDDTIWHSLMEYETQINFNIPGNNLIAVCSYPLGNLSALQIADILKRHQLAIAKDKDDWQIFNTIDMENIPGFIGQSAGFSELELDGDIIFNHPVIYPEKCNGCGLCVDVCEKSLLYLNNHKIAIKTDIKCDWCTSCEAICPTGAISCPFDIA